jgi:hypothetical protein
MAVFKTNFLAGLLVGAFLALLAPFAGTELIATFSAPAQANTGAQMTIPQIVNRANKTDRLHPSHKAFGNSPSKPHKILEGCDPAFSPLSRGAASNFSSRCLA